MSYYGYEIERGRLAHELAASQDKIFLPELYIKDFDVAYSIKSSINQCERYISLMVQILDSKSLEGLDIGLYVLNKIQSGEAQNFHVQRHSEHIRLEHDFILFGQFVQRNKIKSANGILQRIRDDLVRLKHKQQMITLTIESYIDSIEKGTSVPAIIGVYDEESGRGVINKLISGVLVKTYSDKLYIAISSEDKHFEDKKSDMQKEERVIHSCTVSRTYRFFDLSDP